MPAATFTKDYDYITARNVTVAYLAGHSYRSIPKAHYEAAKDAGVIETPTDGRE